MKICLNVSDEMYGELERKLTDAGFEIDNDAGLILFERDRYPSHLTLKNEKGEKVSIKTEDIIFIESFGHEVIVHCTDYNRYYAGERLYQLINLLDSTKFLRVSNCAIISKPHVKRIKTSISKKFILTMSDDSLVDVTRSYYDEFRKIFGI